MSDLGYEWTKAWEVQEKGAQKHEPVSDWMKDWDDYSQKIKDAYGPKEKKS